MDSFRNITVLSLEQATVVPYLTYRLAQDGMNIIRLEHPVYGDPNRSIGENVLGEEKMNAYYLCINAGKKALTLNLAEPDGQQILDRLIQDLSVDVFITNQLPKNYQKLGIEYSRLKKIKSDIIWLGITGFGPDSNEGAYDPILQARSGLMDLTGEAHGDPQVLGIPLPDMGTSEHAYGLLMKALLERELTGKGARLDLSMFESSVSWLTMPITMTSSFGKTISRRGNTHEFFCPVSVFKTQNGYIYLAVGNDRQWKALVSQSAFKTLDKSEYLKNAGRIEDVGNLNRAMNDITRQMTSEDLIALLQSITVPVSKIKPLADVIRDPLVEKKLLFAKDPITSMQITLAPPPSKTAFIRSSHGELLFPPRFGEHNQEIYAQQLGLDEQTLEELKNRNII